MGKAGETLTGDVLLNDRDPGGNPLRVTGIRVDIDGDGKPESFTPGNTPIVIAGMGRLVLRPDGSYEFTPDAGWNGKVPPIDYTIDNGKGGSDEATLNLTVQPLVETNEDATVTIDPKDNKLIEGGNPVITEVVDKDGVSQPITPGDSVTVPHGTVTMEPDGTLTFTPDGDWHGDTTIEYTVTTVDGTETGTTHVTVKPVDDVTDDATTTHEDTPVDIDVLNNDSFEGDHPRVTHVEGVRIINEDGTPVTEADGITPITVTVPNGTVTLNPDGTLKFTPNENWHGDTSFEYTAKTDTGVPETATVTVTVNSVNDAPSGADKTLTLPEDGSHTFTAADFGFSDPVENDALKTIIIDTLPGAGSLTLGGVPVVAGQQIPVADIGSLVYTPAPDAHGANHASFDFQVQDDGGTANGGLDTSATKTITIDVTSVADVTDDTAITPAGIPVVIDALANDSFEGANKTITHINGTAISTGDTITVTGGSVTLKADGTLEFTPDSGVAGDVNFTYTAKTDTGVEETATVTVTVIGVDIVDNTSPGAPGTGDNVLASIDDLEHVKINGQIPPGGELVSLTVTDGTTTVTIDPATVTPNADGGFTTTTDLSGLQDGNLTVTMEAKNSSGDSATVTDTILKDTVTPVAINPITVVDGTVPTITGTGEPGAKIILTIDGVESGEIAVGGDGTWVHIPSDPLDASKEIVISADAEDPVGNTNSTGRKIAGLAPEDLEPGDDAHVLVHESGLPNGSDKDADTESATATLKIGTSEGDIDHLVIGGSLSGSTISGGATITLAQLQNIGTTPIAPITTTYGTLTITGYDATTGTVTYTYTLDANKTHTTAGPDILREDIPIAVKDNNGDTRISKIVAGVVDDVPEANDDSAVTLSEGGATVGHDAGTDTWSAGSANLLDNDTQGADGARVHQITYVGRDGTEKTATIADGGSQTVDTQYGQLTVHSDGTWKYTSVDSANHDKTGGHDTTLDDSFSYTLIDGDGDISNKATQPITVTDTVPEVGTPATNTGIDEAHLAAGSEPGLGPLTVSGSLAVTPGEDAIDTTFTDGAAGTDTTVGKLLDKAWTSGGIPLEYELSNDGHTLIAYKGTGRTEADKIFTANITDPTNSSAGYEFTLNGPLDHKGATDLDLELGFTVTDSDGDTDTGDFTVKVTDDEPKTATAETVDEDGDKTFTTSADANPENTTISQDGTDLTGTDNGKGGKDYSTDHGTVTVNADGTITYTPDTNYSGEEKFTYHTDDGSGTPKSTEVTMTVNPVSDAPDLGDDTKDLDTLEDTSVALGLKTPVIQDDGTGTGNNPTPERLSEITLTISGDGATGVTLSTGGTTLTPAGGKITIVLTDDPNYHVVGVPAADTANGIYHLTTAEYEALVANPAPESGKNFTVTVSATSHEVDASGNILPGVPGATSIQAIDVDVQAVTDGATLQIDGGNSYDVTVAEEGTTIDLGALLTPTLGDSDGNTGADTDGSETYWYTISGLPEGTVVTIDGVATTISATTLTASSAVKTSATPPSITITPPKDYSGDLTGIKITLNAKDTDGDSTGTINTSSSEVTLNLYVTPVAGDVSATGVTTPEDTAVAFLKNVTVTDGGDGTEVIDSISFDLPSGWTTDFPSGNLSTDGWEVTNTGSSYTITFNNDGSGGIVLTEAQREAVLDDFKVTPPAHSSKDATITLSITTTDSGTVNGSTISDTATVERDVKITVTPVAETTDTDTAGPAGNDVTMTGGHDYTTPGEEDAWFKLGQEGGFDLKTGWSNEDPGEKTYASLTPVLKAGDGDLPNAIGSQFKWTDTDGEHIATYTGDPILVPVDALSTLEFKAAPNFSGIFEIEVKAHTVDPGDDADDAEVSHTSDEVAWLKNVLIAPKADEVTLAMSPASGKEDSEIPLSIRPTSSDSGETFDVTISGIPDGAVITYDGAALTVTGGKVTIVNFDSGKALTIRPPENSNDNFTLKVSAESVDTLIVDGDPNSPYTSRNPTTELDLAVTVTGVADAATVDITSSIPDYTEAGVDGGTTPVKLGDLATIELTDKDDGSETLTIRVSGLPEGFSPDMGTLLDPAATGAARVWVLTEAQFAAATLKVPANYSGTITFKIAAVTTENDGNSLTGEPKDVTIKITPSPEATTTASATLEEDVLSNIGLEIVHQNGDTDETLTSVRIAVTQAEGGPFTLYLGDGPGAKTLAQALVDGDISTVTDSGVTYYVLTGAQAGQLAAQGDAHRDGNLSGFDFQFKITDDHYGNTPSGASTTSDWQDAHFGLTATPVTDAPKASITDITGTLGSTTAAEEVAGDDATNETVTLTAADTVTVHLQVTSPDTDGSEHLIRVVIDGVPDGVTVKGGEFIGGGQWLLVYDGADAKPIPGGGVQVPVEFVVNGFAGGLINHEITLTAQVQDRGNTATTTAVEEDSVTWRLTTDFGKGGSDDPATIITWEYNDAPATEDAAFSLSDIITAGVTVNDPSASNVFTVTLENLPEGTQVDGMIRTTITDAGGTREVWSKSVIGPAGATQGDIDALLKTLMDGIKITPPENSNENNAAGDFKFDAKLTTSIAGGSNSNVENITADGADTGTGDKPLVVPVDPVTDNAVIDIRLDTSIETDELNESDSSIPITLTVSNAADGAAGSIVDGTLYLQISADKADLQGGALTIGGVTYTLETVSGVSGVPNGQYYVVHGVAMGSTLQAVYTPGVKMTGGTVTVDAWVRNEETGSTPVTSKGAADLVVNISNDGVTVTHNESSGNEVAIGATGDKSVKLDIAAVLNDNDGSEKIISVLLSNLPDGFLVFTGADPGSAAQAANAGGDGTHNTWVIPLNPDGSLPAYIGILPPPHWSGTLADLKLVVESGETALSGTKIETTDLADVTIIPVADGVDLAPTNSFGAENTLIKLNLNATMQDPNDATVKNADGTVVIAADGSAETTTLRLTGLGEHASFYVGDTLLDASQITYDAGTDTYTLTGLSQADLNTLGLMQAASALTDQNAGMAGVQITAEAWTVESGNAAESTHVTKDITLNLSEQYSTPGDDSLIWTGNAIDGRSGTDTVHLRAGEDLTGADLAAKLSHIEILDLGIGGANAITGLTPDQVKAILGSGGELTIKGTSDDSVALDGAWINNGGIWTGTLADGATTITVKVEGGMTVDTASVNAGFAPMALSLDFPDAPADGSDDPSAFLFAPEGGLPALDGMLTATPDETPDLLDDWLPGQAPGSDTAPASGTDTAADSASTYTDYVPEASLPEDELEHSLANAHALA
ncbi:Ig-like domain-containing protein [Castellaniella hirudinis]|uniref:Ig-like domain-containing protein n=1 Tax=Castellaniella hirudinis TaxID=1144617 RepID=A0ABV8RZY0_9BURK